MSYAQTAPFPHLGALRDCFEAGMDFDTAIGCAGLAEKKPEIVEMLHDRLWAIWKAQAESL